MTPDDTYYVTGEGGRRVHPSPTEQPKSKSLNPILVLALCVAAMLVLVAFVAGRASGSDPTPPELATLETQLARRADAVLGSTGCEFLSVLVRPTDGPVDDADLAIIRASMASEGFVEDEVSSTQIGQQWYFVALAAGGCP